MLIAPFRNAEEIFRRASLCGEPVIFPTDTIYGIGAPISDENANEKIFNIKGRDKSKPFPVLISSFKQAEELAYFDETHKKIMDFLWSRGSFTLILEGKNHVNHLYKLDGKIALRIPSLSNLRVLVDKTGALSATSANPSGVEYKSDSDHIINSFKDLVQYFILSDIQNSASSVIIDLTQKKPSLLRGNFDMSLLASF